MDRRDFLKYSLASASLLPLSHILCGCTKDDSSNEVGETWNGWSAGHFQIHFIYTGACESAFYIFPDGTSMLLDCGEHSPLIQAMVPALPSADRHPGEWIARYVERVNPHGINVDYLMISHYHLDHAGCTEYYATKEIRDGKDYILSGVSLAAETLKFKKAIDRAWPTFDDPLPVQDSDSVGTLALIRQFYEYEQKHNGIQIEKFRLGATDQIVPLHDASGCSGFKVRNICANGRICAEDGTITDLYAERIRREELESVDENGMSLGMLFSYGPFRFFTAGDFSDRWKSEDGTEFKIEDALADVCGHVNVAKLNHHGHLSMPKKLVSTLSAQAYISCVWSLDHNTPDTMDSLSDREAYSGNRVICPTLFPELRRSMDDKCKWFKDIPEASYYGSHIVLDVEPDGNEFSLTWLSAADETMTITNILKFKTNQ